MIKKALTIGLNYKNTPNELYGCISDIVNISNVLTSQYGYLKENIVQLRDDSSSPNLQPTYLNILLNLTKIVNESDKLSEIWIHYSGHGSQMRDRNGDETDGLDETIVPMDYQRKGFISDDDIFNIIKNVKCKTILIFDSCHSGSVCDLQWSFDFNGNGFIKTLNVNKEINNPFIVCLSGCKDAQTSADSFSDTYKMPMGAFTDALIYSMKSNGFNINILKLYADICLYLKSKNYPQKPLLSSSSVAPSIFLRKVEPLPPPPPIVTFIPPPSVPAKPPSLSNTIGSTISGIVKMNMNVLSISPVIGGTTSSLPIKNGMPLPFKVAATRPVKRKLLFSV